MNNHSVGFTGSRNGVFINSKVVAGPTTSRTLETDKGPLQLLAFRPRKTDAQLAWGKEVNHLKVALHPAPQKGQFLLRWKNVGKEAVDLVWVRFHSHIVDSNRDDLLGHVLLKGADGHLTPARKHPAPRANIPAILDRTVVLGPGQILEESIKLEDYVEMRKPVRYQLSIELDVPKGRGGMIWRVKAWTGKILSNVLDITIEK